ncbi:transcription initiation factor IID, 18kD subunit-domain-containing protein [Xylariales sp. PMI_506]|nr:transcription initiation factor IID, 18kD subunit-domain-containing protein [Xylariales sp. PMI_506]
MEPRARAGKNVGKETFPAKDLAALMYAYGDVPNPLPETVRVMDEILTEFVEGVCFEASGHATAAGRQKLKFDDFEFSLRRHPQYLGRVRTMFDKRVEIKNMRKAFQPDDDAVMKNHGKEEGGKRQNGTAANEELLGDDDDDPDVLDAIKKTANPKKKRKTADA